MRKGGFFDMKDFKNERKQNKFFQFDTFKKEKKTKDKLMKYTTSTLYK